MMIPGSLETNTLMEWIRRGAVLRLPRRNDGALGRPRLDCVYRRRQIGATLDQNA